MAPAKPIQSITQRRSAPGRRRPALAFALAVFLASCSISPIASAAGCVPVPLDLVSWWPGEGDPTDVIGSNHGVLFGGSAYTNGLAGRAFSFDGSSGHLRIADRPGFRFTNALTVEVWINPNSGDGRNVVAKWDAAPGPEQRAYAMSIGVVGGYACPSVGVSANGRDDTVVSVSATTSGTNMAVPLHQWSHLAMTYDGAALRIYLNGVQRGQVAHTGGIFPGTNDLAIGGAVGGLAPGQVLGPFDGLIDEPSIYNRALSDTEIQAIFVAGNLGKCGPLRIARQPRSQLGYWGKSVSFTVEASGIEPLNYQWQKDGTTTLSVTDGSLVMTNLQMTDAGSYSVVITNVQGSITSNPAILTMNPAGVSADLHIAVTIDGVVGFTYGIQSTTDLSNTNSWQGLTNVTLSLPVQTWFDVQPATHPQRYYRVLPGPITIP